MLERRLVNCGTSGGSGGVGGVVVYRVGGVASEGLMYSYRSWLNIISRTDILDSVYRLPWITFAWSLCWQSQ